MADIVDKPVDPYTSETIVVGVGSAAVGFATTNVHPSTGLFRGQRARVAYVGNETTSVRFHVTGTVPAAACGMILADGAYLMLDSPTAVENFLTVCTGGTATLYITYFA